MPPLSFVPQAIVLPFRYIPCSMMSSDVVQFVCSSAANNSICLPCAILPCPSFAYKFASASPSPSHLCTVPQDGLAVLTRGFPMDSYCPISVYCA
ncbi:hypothetical protein M413DRAFT_348869 [Hebeloma cylindrosporum]|uniref:Uncharacterized protein n=1 Tax=Hebeloma cylindrosporum TaxID=76867 RepID=A0A0C3BTR1_HEBCY|nr:hypothetical protein M413DRAFT_348869 [Hebeloma cylindrosporum h7]